MRRLPGSTLKEILYIAIRGMTALVPDCHRPSLRPKAIIILWLYSRPSGGFFVGAGQENLCVQPRRDIDGRLKNGGSHGLTPNLSSIPLKQIPYRSRESQY